VPDDEAYETTKETFKVFAVQKGLADFRWLTLPPLDEPPAPRAAELENGLEHTFYNENVTRGMSQPEGMNPLNNLLKMIGADLDKAPETTRSASVVVDPKQEWVTKQVQIRVKR
jgi:hypothetical protein